MTTNDVILTLLLGFMALLYASVGHAGSSGYQAAMALLGVDAAVMKTTAQSLNVFVAAIGLYQFARRGHFDFRLWALLCCASAPAAVYGGKLQLPPGQYYYLVAVVLWVAAMRLWWQPRKAAEAPGSLARRPPLLLILVVGLFLGFLSGMTGTGGGIFLTPVLVLAGWCPPRKAAGISAGFILITSSAALLGGWQHSPPLPRLFPLWLAVVIVCGTLGSWYGSKHGSPLTLRRLLAVVLVIAGVKLVMTVS